MRCENCGAELADGTRFCTSCGTPVSADNAQQPVVEHQPAVEQQQADYNQQLNYNPQQLYYPQPVIDPHLSVGQYIGMFFLMAIPLVNIILLFVWSFGTTNKNRKNYARAVLIMILIGLVLSVIFALTIWPLIAWRYDMFGGHGRWW